MNYRYRIDDQDFIFSNEEDVLIQQAIQAGKSHLYLREGKLMINTAFIRYRKETEQLTDDQENGRLNSLKLEEGKSNYDKSSYLRNTHKEFYEKMKWEHGSECSCKVAIST